ncbi:MAG: EscU/YscU/HrcU family type III secretion system export apparatus switch protein [Pseudomonadota bacterium]|nr:EscU/YscU/HrcU family type III secretion system export apparatus switch protein [Pseudomonadota bacterium]
MRHKPSERSKSNIRPARKRPGVTNTLNRAKSAVDEKVAVALSYDPRDEYSAPEVVATGRGHIAEQLLKLALEYGVKIHEDADLAEILHALDIGDEIPVEAFVAVAEILRYIYDNEGVQPPEIAANAK